MILSWKNVNFDIANKIKIILVLYNFEYIAIWSFSKRDSNSLISMVNCSSMKNYSPAHMVNLHYENIFFPFCDTLWFISAAHSRRTIAHALNLENFQFDHFKQAANENVRSWRKKYIIMCRIRYTLRYMIQFDLPHSSHGSSRLKQA